MSRSIDNIHKLLIFKGKAPEHLTYKCSICGNRENLCNQIDNLTLCLECAKNIAEKSKNIDK